MKTQNKTFDLASIKENAKADLLNKNIFWNGETLDVSDTLLEKLIIAGLYRQASADSAKGGYDETFEKEFLTRIKAGFLTQREYNNSKKTIVEKTGTKKPSFGQMEIISQARSMTKDPDTLAKLDVIAAYPDDKFGLLLVAVSDKPDSIISRAISELNRIQTERVEKERAAMMQELDII